MRKAPEAPASPSPGAEQLALTLAPDPDAPALARNLVGDACRAWRLPDLLHPGRLVMSELVTNAVEHARSTIRVELSRRVSGLRIAVSDASPVLPHLIDLAPPRRGLPLDERGRGLRTVQAVATAWGAMPTANGKVVWATLRPPRTTS
jgi:anti-sigma regulatory factor (Ser/Thr protein kinase)